MACAVDLTMIIRTTMPLGLAAINRRYVSVGRGRMVLAKEYREFRDALAGQVQGSPLAGPLCVTVAEGWLRTNRTGPAAGLALGDIDSPLKCILDALQHGGAFENDSQVVRLIASKEVADCTLIEVEQWPG